MFSFISVGEWAVFEEVNEEWLLLSLFVIYSIVKSDMHVSLPDKYRSLH